MVQTIKTMSTTTTHIVNKPSLRGTKQSHPLVPELRFKEFEVDWNTKKLGEIYKINAGGDIDVNHVSQIKTEKYQYPIYANARKGKGFYAYSDIYKVEPNTVTIAGRGAHLGIAHARDHRFYPIVRLLVLKPLNEEDIRFSECAINRINLFKESTGVPQLTAPQISGYQISFPTLPEQQKIASFLSAVDDKVQQLTKKKKLLEHYKKGVMQRLFCPNHDSLDLHDEQDYKSEKNQENLINPKKSRLRPLRFKAENGNPYPDWEEKRLGEVFGVIRGKGISKDQLKDNGETKCILYGQLYTTYSEVVFNVVSRTDTNEGVLSMKGDLLVPSSTTTTTGIDLANVTALNEEGVLLGGDISILRSKNDTNNVFYAYYLSNHKKYEIAAFAQGSTIVHLSYNHFKVMRIDIPVIEEQQKIATYLSSIDTKIEVVNTQITQNQTFKKGLLQQMFV
jgi:type I restriction enzyme S subunit